MATENERYADYLNFPNSWKRPEGPPRVWRVVDGRRKTASGETRQFTIQEVPKELEETVVDFMVRYFIPEEPVFVDLGIGADPLAVRELRTRWRDVLVQGVSIIALMVNSNPSAKPVIAGVNVLRIMTTEDEETGTQFESRILQKLAAVQLKLIQESDVSKKHAADKYLRAYGLSVHPCFREQGLGAELLRTHDDIGLAYKIPVTEHFFTSTGAQTLAARVGYEVQVKRKYSELLDDEGNVAFPNVTDEFIEVMIKRLCLPNKK